MKKFKSLRRKVAIVANVLLALQILTVGMFLGAGSAKAEVAQLAILSPVEDARVNSLDVTVSGTVNIGMADPDEYFLESGTDVIDIQADYSWSQDFNYQSNGEKEVTINLKSIADSTAIVATATVDFVLIYPSQPTGLVVEKSILHWPHQAPTAQFILDWDKNPESGITYKAGYREVGAENFILETEDHLHSRTSFSLNVNTEYEFIVYALHDYLMSEPSETVTGIVENVTSLADAPDYSNVLDFNVSYTATDGKNPISLVKLYYQGPTDLAPVKYEDGVGEDEFTTSPIAFSATAEGTYDFYTVAVDSKHFREVYGQCDLGETEAANGGKCIPDDSTIVDMTAPAGVTDLTGKPSDGQIALTWTQPVDDTSKTTEVSGIDFVRVYRDGLALVDVPFGTNSFVDKTVKSSTEYEYYVAAFDKAGNGKNESNKIDVLSMAKPVTPVASVVTPVAAVTEIVGQETGSTAGTDQSQGEVKSDSTGQNLSTTTTTKPDDQKKTETKEKKNIPLWGIIFLIILAGIGGYLFYTQSPETETPRKNGKNKK